LGWGEDVTDTLMNPVWQNSKEFWQQKQPHCTVGHRRVFHSALLV
jgi:hypothetical protein